MHLYDLDELTNSIFGPIAVDYVEAFFPRIFVYVENKLKLKLKLRIDNWPALPAIHLHFSLIASHVFCKQK